MGVRMGWREIVAIGQFVDFFRCEGSEALIAYLLRQLFAIAVAPLEVAEEEDKPFKMLDGEKVVDVDQRVRDTMGQAMPAQISGELVDIRAQALDFPKLRFVEIPDEKVDFAAVGKISGHFDAEENVGVMGDGLATVEPVMISNGLEGHPGGIEFAVKRLGFAVTLRHAEPAKDPFARPVGKAGVKLEVNAQHNRRKWWVGSRA